MQSDVPLDYAVFQLSPRRSHCELFVSYDGTTEKLASGLLKPYVTHLKVAEEQVALAVKSIKLEVERYKNAETWFTKRTLERFVQFVGTPEVLEMVNTFDAEMSQLEAARKIYSQGSGDCGSGTLGADGVGATATSDATKKELLRAIDVRLAAVKQDLTAACSRASAAGFNPESVSELQLFADRFGAHRLSEACSKFVTLTQRRSDLFNNDNAIRSSTGSDMSLDDPSDDLTKPSTCTTTTVVTTFPLRRFSREPSPSPINDVKEREDSKEKDTDKDKGISSATTSTTTESSSKPSGTPQLTRRLSVQERISMFENKAQKDNSPSTATTPTSTGGKPEFRRLCSDVTSSDKAVLRRWSGASDMSIDVSGERKEPDSSANTPTSTSTSSFRPAFPPKSKEQYDLKSEEGDKSYKLPVGPKSGGSATEESASDDSNSKIASFSGRSSDQTSGKIIRSTAASIGRGEDFGFENQSTSVQSQFRSPTSDQTATEKLKSPFGGGSKPQEDIWINFGSSAAGIEGTSVDSQGDAKKDELSDQPFSRSYFGVDQKRTVETDLVSATLEVHTQSVNQNTAGSLPWGRSLGEEAEKSEEKYFESLNKQTDSDSTQMEITSLFKGSPQGHGFASDQVKKFGGRREESMVGESQMGLNWKNASENEEVFSSVSSLSMDQAQRARQPKGNQEMNDELKMKANELEKLFAEHKLRVPGDQSNSARRTRPSEMSKEMEAGYANRKLEIDASCTQLSTPKLEAARSSSKEKFKSTPLSKTVDNNVDDVTPKHYTYSLSFSDDSRGKLYQRYMQKRDAKLRDDWSSKRAEKESKLKAMRDSLEKSRAEMKVKLASSADKRSAANNPRQRAEKMRSFNVRSAIKREQPMDSCMSDEDEDQAEFVGRKLSDAFLGDSSSRSVQSKKVLPNRNTTSSTPRNSTVPIPRSSGKGSNFAAGRRRLPADNPLAQSVPNFSDLRKENTKPSSAGSKPARPQGRNHARKKSISEDVSLINEEKPRRSQSLRKSVASPKELNDSRDYDDVDDTVLSPSKHDEVENEEYEKISRDMDSKNLLRKGNCVGQNSGADSRSKASEMMDVVRNGHNYGVSFQTEVMTDAAKGEEYDFEATIGEESADIDNSKGRLSQESDKSGNSGYDNSNDLRLLSQTGSVSAAELPASMPSFFHSTGSIQDSPGESPGSWNSRVRNPFSFQHEISDIDASDSPIRSPASWNFHTLAQSEAEAARMRKKWGAAQKPIVGVDSSNGQSRKDVTRGLKRFLKFGRKNRASESLADWISVTTSEGDDSEDGRDIANRSSEDLRKSRMGFLQSHNSDEGFNDNDLLSEQVRSSIPTPPANFKLRNEHLSGSSLKAPKSFFSLSNFRSKGSDSKHR